MGSQVDILIMDLKVNGLILVDLLVAKWISLLSFYLSVVELSSCRRISGDGIGAGQDLLSLRALIPRVRLSCASLLFIINVVTMAYVTDASGGYNTITLISLSDPLVLFLLVLSIFCV